MIERSLLYIQEKTNGDGLHENFHSTVVKGVSINSKTTVYGNLFIPIKRLKNGHDYVEEAIKNGASALLWQKSEPNPPTNIPLIFVEDTLLSLQNLAASYRNDLSVKVIGVTGSNGKTTTKDLINSVLTNGYKVHKTKGNYNSQIGLPLTILDVEEDTDFLILEMGMSERGQIKVLSEIAKPDIGVITMIGQSHLVTLGSRDNIAKEKLDVESGIMDGGLFIINGDEPLLSRNLPVQNVEQRKIKVTTFGYDLSNDVYIKESFPTKNGFAFKVNGLDFVFELPMLGHHNVLNALIAIIIGKHFGISDSKINDGLLHAEITGMRFEVLSSKRGMTVINDAWNASPVSVKAAITTFEDLKGYNKKFLVIGDMLELGNDEEKFHKEIVNELNPDTIHFVYSIGKYATSIYKELLFKYPIECIEAFYSKEELVTKLLGVTKPNDAILVKASRGLALEEVVEKLL